MPIFISHTTKDNALAQQVHRRLTSIHGISCYIDDVDVELAKQRGKSGLTPLLVDRLRRCDTLLAVVTANTKESWWVPFEIGTAREMPRAIASVTSLPETPSSLPEYLLEWPRLRDNVDFDTFAREYKRRNILLESGQIKINNSVAGPQTVRKFESDLMTALAQRSF